MKQNSRVRFSPFHFLLLPFLLLSFNTTAQRVCCTNYGAIAPTAAWQTISQTNSGYYSFAATAGCSYTFSHCQGGGSYTGDTYLTICNSACGAIAWNDDFCGLGSELTWIAPATTTYQIHLGSFGGAGCDPLTRVLAYIQSCSSCAPPDYCMPAGTTNICAGNFFDSGGSAGNYADNQNMTTTFCSNAGNCVQIAFTAFNTESCCDFLRIYDGPTTASPLIGTYSGATSPGTVTSTSGCLTFWWTSDGSVISTGWAATISCVVCPPPPPPFCYSSGAIAYAPDPVAGTSIALADDQYSGVINIGFPFCFDGVSYTQLLISSNNYVDFDLGGAGGYSPWSIAGPIPTTTPAEVMRTIMAPWEDLLPPSGGTISYQTLGVAPNRRFIINWFQVPMFSCTGQLYTSQLKLYETTNCMEMHLANKPTCVTWNGGYAIQGINNANGTSAWAPAGRNFPTVWTAVNDGMMIWPTCAPCNSGGPCTTAPLPIDLLSFNAECSNGKVNISWATASQRNNDFFTIERTSDGINFEIVGIVDGAGNSTQNMDYSFIDEKPFYGTSYYRLKQTDFNGQFEYFDPLVVNCDAMNLLISPNPNTGVFLIEGVEQNSDLIITDMMGQTIYKTKIVSAKTEIDLSDLGKGVYFIRIDTERENIVKRIIIN